MLGKILDRSELIWISPVISHQEMEGLFHWVNLHFIELKVQALTSFSKIEVTFLNEPKEALRLRFPVVPIVDENAVHQLKESIWSEVFVGSQPAPRPYALSLQSLVTRRAEKRLICFDMDSTLIDQEVIDEIARTQGLYDQVAKITENAMQGKLDFKASLKARVNLFRGMQKAQAESIIPSLTVTAGGEKLLGQLRFKSMKTAVVSGGFEFILKHFQKQLFLDQVFGNVLTTDDEDLFTGEVEDPIVDAEYKKKLVARMKENYKISHDETVTVGDGANDVPMMSEAGVSVSFCGKPALSAHANTLILDRNLLWIGAIL